MNSEGDLQSQQSCAGITYPLTPNFNPLLSPKLRTCSSFLLFFLSPPWCSGNVLPTSTRPYDAQPACRRCALTTSASVAAPPSSVFRLSTALISAQEQRSPTSFPSAIIISTSFRPQCRRPTQSWNRSHLSTILTSSSTPTFNVIADNQWGD
ncbi:hypothetical protein BC936DRAFT_142083 [Jimgerdemannia flammicorona]|uniref:Uncharacterized protein n=1 Tax=Jimgerdemannia flammicorona TaxID=994334 RepID=A0A433DFN4_9FUNG|nr:hypothetical protein BC936DRAFT_142083 [Jimgerdemannia flammicorona]